MNKKKEIVTEDNFEDLLLKSVDEAVGFVKGEVSLAAKKAKLIEGPPSFSKTKIKKLRSELHMSQTVFGSIFGVSTSAVQHWEQGIRNMPKPACRLLGLIEKDRDTILGLMIESEVS